MARRVLKMVQQETPLQANDFNLTIIAVMGLCKVSTMLVIQKKLPDIPYGFHENCVAQHLVELRWIML